MSATTPMSSDVEQLRLVASDIVAIMESPSFQESWSGPNGHVRDVSLNVDNTLAGHVETAMKKIARGAAFFSNKTLPAADAARLFTESHRHLARMIAQVDLAEITPSHHLGKLRGEFLTSQTNPERAKAFLEAVVQAKGMGELTMGAHIDVIAKALEFCALAEKLPPAPGRVLGAPTNDVELPAVFRSRRTLPNEPRTATGEG